MDRQEKLKLMEEVMDLADGMLSEGDELASYDEWDSLSALAFMSVMTSRFHKNIMPSDIKKLITVADAIDLME